LPPATTQAPHPAFTRLLHHPKLNASRLALHLLYLDPTTPEAPNVFLNLARLFAPTRTVLLVPGTPKPPPPSSITSLSIAHVSDPVVVRVAAPGPGGIAVNEGRPAPPAVLSPMLILRDHPLWCTERFSFAPATSAPRAADWGACLWQVQLETFGAASSGGPTLQGWRWNVEPEPAEPALPSVTVSRPPLCIPLARMGVDRNSLLFAAGWMYGIVSRRVCSRSSGLKYWAKSGAVEAADVWGHALDARVRIRCAGYTKYADNGRTAGSSQHL